MARIEALDLSEARAAVSEKRSLTSEGTLKQLSGGGGWGGFSGAKLGRLTQDWASSSRSIDQDLVVDLRKLRSRARNQAINSPIATKFLIMVRNNVIGHHGVKLSFKIAQQRKSKRGSGLDDASNQELARAWSEWGKKGTCTVCGRYSWRALQLLMIENVARDGEQFLRIVNVPRSESPFGFKLQLIDADQVDDSLNITEMPNGNQVRMGVEVDRNQKPVAYHVFDGNPYEGYFGVRNGNRVRVPAEQIIHFFIAHRTGQTRGYPWFASSMSQLNQLDGYFLAELVKSRVGATVVMSIETDPNAPSEQLEGDGLNADGSKAVDLGVGTALPMPTGQHLKNNTTEHDAAFEPFVKQSNRIIASGMGVAYHKLCNDLAGINYSSGRLGELEERDFWMEMQSLFIDDVCEIVYANFLKCGLLWGGISLAVADAKRFSGPALKWEPRRWAWVDPLKDVQASTLLVQNGFETHEAILNSQGRDLEDVYNSLKREQDLADELGLQLGTDIRGMGTSEINNGPIDEPGEGEGENEPKSGDEKAQKPKAKTKPAPAKPKARSLSRGMHPANAALLFDIGEE
jgi:lambda family phage portal protein